MTLARHRSQDLNAPSGWKRPLRIVLGGWSWLALFAAAAQRLLTLPMSGLATVTLLLALPAMAALWQQDAADRLLALHPYRPGALLHRWHARRLLPMVLRALLALVFAASALVQTPFMRWADWLLLAAAVPAYALLETACYRMGFTQFSTPLYAQRGVRRLVQGGLVVLLAVAWMALGWLDHTAAALPLGERVAQWQSGWAQIPSHALRWALDALAWSQAGMQTVLAALPADRRWQVLASGVLAPLALFGYSTLAVAGTALPLHELRRAAALPLTPTSTVPRWTPAHAGMWAAVAILAIWMWLDLAGHTEYLARTVPSPFAVQAVPQCERLGGQAYRVGTQALLAQLGERTQSELAGIQLQACERLAQVRALTEPGVDAYLDWYFSLGAEWARLAAMLAGDADLLMRVKFEQLVLQNPVVGSTLESIQRDYAAQWDTTMRSRNAVIALLESQRLVITGDQCQAVSTAIDHPPWLRLQGDKARLAASTGAALVAGTFAGTVAAKAMGKASMKVASKLLLKAAAKKGMGKAGSAVAGAALGSVVAPGVGTVIGAGIGAAVGLALGTGIDLALLAAEEKLTRADMRRDLLAAVDESLQPYRSTFSCP